MVKRASAVEARRNFSRLLSEAHFAGEVTVVERNRQPVAVIIGYDEYQELVSRAQRSSDRAPKPNEVHAEEDTVSLEQAIADLTLSCLGRPPCSPHPLRESPIDANAVAQAVTETFGTDDAVEIVNLLRDSVP